MYQEPVRDRTHSLAAAQFKLRVIVHFKGRAFSTTYNYSGLQIELLDRLLLWPASFSSRCLIKTTPCVFSCSFLLAAFLPGGLTAQTFRDFVTPLPLPGNSALVIGFLGGVEAWSDPHRGVRKLALDLRASQSHLIFAETIENRHAKRALQLITRALDRNEDGELEKDEVAGARLILYGQSLGGAAAIHTAELLNRRGIPVLLTVQVDSVGVHDGVIPPNVSKAVNFYQQGSLTFRGRNAIRAQDPRRTQIIGNFQRRYAFWAYSPQDRANASRMRLALGGGHVRMEADPDLWAQIEQLILKQLIAAK